MTLLVMSVISNASCFSRCNLPLNIRQGSGPDVKIEACPVLTAPRSSSESDIRLFTVICFKFEGASATCWLDSKYSDAWLDSVKKAELNPRWSFSRASGLSKI